MPSADAQATLHVVRRLMLALLTLGLIGILIELLLIGHDEDAWQFVPIVGAAVGLLAIGWHVIGGSSASIWSLRIVMLALLGVGATGAWLHYQANTEFQVELDPTTQGFALFIKAMQATTPPALAPGLMAQLGLLGLLYTYRHPALGRPSREMS